MDPISFKPSDYSKSKTKYQGKLQEESCDFLMTLIKDISGLSGQALRVDTEFLGQGRGHPASTLNKQKDL